MPRLYRAPLSPEDLRAIAQAMRAGAVAAYPTETVYGLGAAIACEAAQARIFDLKGRQRRAPLIVLVPGPEWLDRLGRDVPGPIRTLAERLWPGPLTLVVPAAEDVSEVIRGGGGTVGLRWSPDPVASALVAAVGPITSTSANRSGTPSPRTVAECSWEPPGPDLVIDGGPRWGRGSTVVAAEGDGVRVLREGDLPLARIRELVPVAPESEPAP